MRFVVALGCFDFALRFFGLSLLGCVRLFLLYVFR